MTDEELQKLGKVTLAAEITIILLGLCLIPLACADTISDKQAVRCLIGEAANQGAVGMQAVGEVLRTRGSTSGVFGCQSNLYKTEPPWVHKMAKKAWSASAASNITKGATHFESIDFKTPYWAESMVKTVLIGKHQFYKETKQ